MCTSSAFWLPSGCGIAALPRKVPSLMSAIEAFTTATIIAFSVSVSLTSAPSLDFNESTLPSAFSIVPRMRTVCAMAAAHDAAMIAPASAIRIVLIILFPRKRQCAPSQRGGAHIIRRDVVGLSRGFQAMLPDDRYGGRRGDEFDQRPGSVRLLRAGVDAGGEHRHALELARQRADVIDAGEMHQLADLLEPDLGLTASSVFFNASAEPMSGFAAPLRTASPTPDFAKSTRLPATALPSLICSSIA